MGDYDNTDGELIYTRLKNQDKFDAIQDFILNIFKIAEQYYDTNAALKIRLELEHFLELHGNLNWREIRHKKRSVEEPFGIIEQGVFSRIT